MTNALFAVPPIELVRARRLAHDACQWPSRAARANLPARADDSHSALRWDDGVLLSEPLDANGTVRLGFAFADQALVLQSAGRTVRLNLAGLDAASVGAWVDSVLDGAGLAVASGVPMPYELEPVDHAAFASEATSVAALGAWYAAADVALHAVLDRFGHLAVTAPAIRCWPHHFDIAMLLALDEGDPETARSAGIGLSPGDGVCAEPYVYCNPWPVPTTLPNASAPLRWHTGGFTSLLCPVSVLGPVGNLDEVMASAVDTVITLLTVDNPIP